MINRPTRRARRATVADSAHALARLTLQAESILANHVDRRHAIRAARCMAAIWQITLDIRPKATPPADVGSDGGSRAIEGSDPRLP